MGTKRKGIGETQSDMGEDYQRSTDRPSRSERHSKQRSKKQRTRISSICSADIGSGIASDRRDGCVW